MRFASNVSFVLFILLQPAVARSDIILDVQNLTFVSGSSGSVDVNIRSTALETVDFYQYRFRITDAGGGNVGKLRFSDPQSESEAVDANYLFGADSLGITTIVENGPAFNEVSGTDLTLSGLGVDIDTNNLLFARLDFDHVLPGGVDPRLAANDEFLISLVDAETRLLSDSADFTSLVAFSGTAGTLSASHAAVPEPSGIGLLVIGGMLFVLRRRHARPGARPGQYGQSS